MFIGILAVLRLLASSNLRGQRGLDAPPLRDGDCRVVQVLSSDKLLVRQPHLSTDVRVRLLGAHSTSEEDGELADSARQWTRGFVAGRQVTLQFDNHRLDRDGCYLAYVWADGEQLNSALLAAGLARYDYVPGNSAAMDRSLRQAEAAARQARAGIWE
jgi:endonuclease YncB( thermonuclease family)